MLRRSWYCGTNCVKDLIKDSVKKAAASLGFEIRRRQVAPGRNVWMRLLGIDTVIDIGANIGQFAAQARLDFPSAHIYSFEPLPDCYQRLVRSRAADPFFTAFETAVSDVDGTLEFRRSSSSASSSLLRMAQLHKQSFPTTAGEKVVRVKSRRLDEIAQTISFGEHVLLKMDVQGAEDRVIKGGADTIARADVVIAETSFVQLYENQPLFRDVFLSVTGLGFRYAGSCGFLPSPIHGLNLSEDSVFLNERAISRLTDAALVSPTK